MLEWDRIGIFWAFHTCTARLAPTKITGRMADKAVQSRAKNRQNFAPERNILGGMDGLLFGVEEPPGMEKNRHFVGFPCMYGKPGYD